VMIDVVRLQDDAGELREQVGFLVRSPVEPMTPMADPPSISRASLNFFPTKSNASSQVDGVSLPFLRMSGWVRRSS
jgi:hypothetical protein